MRGFQGDVYRPRRCIAAVESRSCIGRAGEFQAAGSATPISRPSSGRPVYPMPNMPGHEGAGIVEAIGRDVTAVRPGDHVICSWNPRCSHCFHCERGQPILCEPFVRHRPRGLLLGGHSRNVSTSAIGSTNPGHIRRTTSAPCHDFKAIPVGNAPRFPPRRSSSRLPSIFSIRPPLHMRQPREFRGRGSARFLRSGGTTPPPVSGRMTQRF